MNLNATQKKETSKFSVLIVLTKNQKKTGSCFFSEKYLNLQHFKMEYYMEYDFYKNKKSDTIYWVDKIDSIGEFLFSFDKKKIYNLFADYPHSLTAEQKATFDKENPYWAAFFKDRK